MKPLMLLLTCLCAISCSKTSENSIGDAAESDRALAARIDEYMMSGVDKGFAGTLLVAKGGKIILSKGYGLANRERNIAHSPETVSDIGSNAKQFTAAAIMTLVDQNKLSTKDRLEQFFDGLPDDKRDITVHQLLTHTSGLDSGFGGDFDGTTKEKFLATVFASELATEPGQYRYSNAGYSILAAIIERVSGEDYETYLARNLFEPAGLTHTGYLLPKWDRQSLAGQYWHGIVPKGTTVERYLDDGAVSWNLVGNGGIASTSNDVYKWLEALKSDKVLSQSARDELFGEHAKIPGQSDRYYGYGWGVTEGYQGKTLITHNGGNGTYFSAIAWYPESDVAIIYSNNTSTAEWPAYQVHRMIFEPDYVPRAFAISPHRLVYEYVQSRPAADLAKLPAYFEKETGEPIKRQSLLNRVGIEFEEQGQHQTAIALFKLNIALFPGKGSLWESLGEGYRSMGNKDQAIASYRKSLDLAPDAACGWCANARRQLALLNEV